MYRSRAAFKQALWFCKRNKEQLQADALAFSYNNVDAKKFRKSVTIAANRKATAHVNKISGAVGEQNICDMWCNHANKMDGRMDNISLYFSLLAGYFRTVLLRRHTAARCHRGR